MPVFVGLFAIPWVIMNIIAKVAVPKQYTCNSIDVSWGQLLPGAFAGLLGGFIAAFLPAVTGGVGGLLAGHAVSQRDDRAFIISQGASKVVYYLGAYLLFLMPGLNFKRGGLAWMINTIYTPTLWRNYFFAIAGVIISSIIAFFLLEYFSKVFANVMSAMSYKGLSYIALCIIILLLYFMTGWRGLLLSFVATAIGLIPVLFGSRRMNCLGVILVPIALNMSGYGTTLAKYLGLI